ncbi:hypothetical protein CLV59_101779 [Chitinophaga dinghuensis]|uniref:Uncharacterized protein n=1 Tax=Chitinophaga dinghuensis TaxID=1539050 RepID=A0A327WJP9_9BACT|nr:hypothetical protein [Chitinophaga dinghuensis]RAJ88014.1 hypothetical protein CLV59_101779 [Chitinophaga dinghuensis]
MDFINSVQQLGGLPNADVPQLEQQLEELFDMEGYEDYWEDTVSCLDLPRAVKALSDLDKAGYFRYAATDMKDLIHLYHIVWFNEDGLYNDSLYGPESILFLDQRFVFLDAEYLCETGGFEFFLTNLRLATDSMGVELDYEERYEAYAPGKYAYRMFVNGKPFTFNLDAEKHPHIFAHAALKSILIVNKELELQQYPERLYPISLGTDGAVMILTPEQQQMVGSLIPDVQNKPLTIEEWCKEFDVPYWGDDPELYLG